VRRTFTVTGLLAVVAMNAVAQLSVGPDTAIFCPSEPVTLVASLSGGSYGTESYTFLNIPYSPEPFTGTIPTSTGGSSFTSCDDCVTNALPIGFTFCFLGQEYTQFYIGTNGWISFSPGQPTSYTSQTIPSNNANVPKNAIMSPWEDWFPGGGGNGGAVRYETTGVAPDRRLVVSWVAVPMFQCTSSFGTFQIVLHETTNIIENHLQDKPNCPGWAGGTGTQGVHNNAGTLAFTAPGRNSTQWTATNESTRFVPSGITWTNSSGAIVGYGDTLSFLPQATDTYFATVTLCDGNTYVDSAFVRQGYVEPELSDVTVCPGSSLTLDAGDQIEGTTFVWQPGNVDLQVLEIGSVDESTLYTVEITNICGTLVHEINVELNVVELGGDQEVCDGATATLTATGSLSGGTWSATGPGEAVFMPGPTVSDPEVIFSQHGGYVLTYTDDFCQRETTAAMAVSPIPVVSVVSDTNLVCIQDELALNFISNTEFLSSIEWTPFGSSADTLIVAGSDSMAYDPLSGNFIIGIEVENACGTGTAEYMYTVQVCEIEIPNVFNPNSDIQANTLFNVQALEFFPGNNMKVFDRWGRLFLNKDNYHLAPWDGSGASDGVYYYVLTREGYEPITGYVHKLGGSAK